MNPVREDLIAELLAAPGRIEAAELALHRAKAALTIQRNAYADQEAELLIEGVEGKNAQDREARLRIDLAEFGDGIRTAEIDLMGAERAYNRAVNDWRSLRSVAALLAGAEEERRAA